MLRRSVFLIITSVLILLQPLPCSSTIVETPGEGRVGDLPGLPEVTLEQFAGAEVRIEIFSIDYCPICDHLLDEFPLYIYKKYTVDEVAIRVWNVAYPQVQSYLERLLDSLEVPLPLRGVVPLLIINEKYYYSGYDRSLRDALLQDIESVLRGDPPPYGSKVAFPDVDLSEMDFRQVFQTLRENIFMKTILYGKGIDHFRAGLLDSIVLLAFFSFLPGYFYFLNQDIVRNDPTRERKRKKASRKVKSTKKINPYLAYLFLTLGIAVALLVTWVWTGGSFLNRHVVFVIRLSLSVTTLIVVFSAVWMLYVKTANVKEGMAKEGYLEKRMRKIGNTYWSYPVFLAIGLFFAIYQNDNYSLILNMPGYMENVGVWSFFFYIVGFSILGFILVCLIELFKSKHAHGNHTVKRRLQVVGLLYFLGLIFAGVVWLFFG